MACRPTTICVFPQVYCATLRSRMLEIDNADEKSWINDRLSTLEGQWSIAPLRNTNTFSEKGQNVSDIITIGHLGYLFRCSAYSNDGPNNVY